jgi:hypothetical protein
MTCKDRHWEGYELKDDKLAIAADVHRPREWRLIRLRGVLVATV